MKTKGFFIVLLAMLSLSRMAASQVWQEWAAIYDSAGTGQSEIARNIVLDSQGNVIVCGVAPKAGVSEEYQFLTIKYTSRGAQIWKRACSRVGSSTESGLLIDARDNVYVIGDTSNTNYNNILMVVFDSAGNRRRTMVCGNQTDTLAYHFHGCSRGSDGSVYVAGCSNPLTGLGNTGIAYKYNPYGIQEWSNTFSLANHYSNRFYAIAADAWGDVIAAGVSLQNPMTWPSDIVVRKISSDGITRWTSTYPNEAYQGGYIPGLTLSTAGEIYVPAKTENYFSLLKYDSGGVFQWIDRFDPSTAGDDYVRAIAIDSQDHPVICGQSYENGTGKDAVTIKVDPSGSVEWVSLYNSLSNYEDEAMDVKVDAFDCVYVTGYCGRHLSSPLNFGNCFTRKYNPAGQLVWLATYASPGDMSDGGNALALGLGNKIYVAGFTSAGANSNTNYLTIKYGQNSLDDYLDLPKSDEVGSCQISPNPFNPTTALSYELRAASPVSLKIYDTAGRLVSPLVDGQQEAGTHSVTFDGSDLPSGVYLYRLTAGTNTATGKMVLLK